METCTTYQTPVGPVWLMQAEQGEVTALGWGVAPKQAVTAHHTSAGNELIKYFKKTIQHFESKVKLKGTPFQLKVWNRIAKIPYGTVVTYGQLARHVGSHPRAVARACGQNPVPLIIPCHRVVASDGKLCGYSGGQGLATKITLLQLEGVAFTGSAMQLQSVRITLPA